MCTPIHLLAIDGLNIIRRVFGAIPGDDAPQKVQGALKSSMATIRRALNQFEPTHVVFVLDAGGETWRHRLYPAYKADRKPMYGPLREALPEFQAQLLATTGIRTLCVPDVEADDVLATLTKGVIAVSPEAKVTVLSTDKDMAALSNDQVCVYDIFLKLAHDAAWVRTKFGVEIDQLQDLLALTGDASDGIPGVPQVAGKTAQAWIAQHKTLEGVLAAAATATSGKGKQIAAHAADARLSRQLLEFAKVPLGIKASDLRWSAAV